MLCIFQEIKQSFSLPVNFLNKDILKPWKTFLPYFNCIKTVSAGRERWKTENERARERGRMSEGEREGEKEEKRKRERMRIEGKGK